MTKYRPDDALDPVVGLAVRVDHPHALAALHQAVGLGGPGHSGVSHHY